MRAIDVMVHDVVTVRPDTDVAEAIKLGKACPRDRDRRVRRLPKH